MGRLDQLGPGRAAAMGAEQAVRVGELAQQRLRGLDLGHRVGGGAERARVRERVVADPVALGVGALGEPAVRAQLLADDEERGLRPAVTQNVQDPGGGLRVRAVVERQGELRRRSQAPWRPGRRSATASRSSWPAVAG